MAETVRVPVTMIVEGVLAGSAGPLFYGADMLARTAKKWDGMPVTYGHPGVPAREAPDLVVGRVVEPRMAGGNKLRGVAEIDLNRLRKLDAKMAWDIASRRRVEVSTGLFYSRDGQSGTWNGQRYRSAVVSMLPDHLALIPEGGQGACSVRDGCGLNNVKGEMDMGEMHDCTCGKGRIVGGGSGGGVTGGDPIQHKAGLIAELVGNLAGAAQDQAIADYNRMTVPELEALVVSVRNVRGRTQESFPQEQEPRQVSYWGVQGAGGYGGAHNEQPILEAPSLEAAMARDVAEAEVRNERVKRLGGIDRDGRAAAVANQPQTDPETGEPVLGPPVWNW